MEHRVIRPGGEIIWIRSRGRAKPGDPARMMGVSYDITERKRAEERLRESEARLAAILEQLPAGVGLFDREGRLHQSNVLLRRFMGSDLIPSLIPNRESTGAALAPTDGCWNRQNIPARERFEARR